VTREEFGDLALKHLEEIAAFSRRLTGNAADADDLVQATFERAFGSWRQLRQPASCRAWLFRIARNIFADGRRAVSGHPQLQLVEAEKEPSSALVVPAETVERSTAHDLEVTFARLPWEQRDALLLCDLWGFCYAEIADIVQTPIGTVRSRISRARARVAALLLDRAERGREDGRRP
jgi:RNA polymerase sigma-70 factor (ECF subfamily)